MPASREAKSGWLIQLARNAEIGLCLVRHLGGSVVALDLPFRCLLHGDCEVTLTRGRNGQVVYRDPSLAWCKREFQTIPELAVALRTLIPKRLRPLQLALWSLSLLYQAGLIELPMVDVLPGTAESPESVRRARDGFELLIRCRWFLDPGKPVAYTRNFVEAWCGIATQESRFAISSLIKQGVIRRVGQAASNFRQPTSLYLPGQVGSP